MKAGASENLPACKMSVNFAYAAQLAQPRTRLRLSADALHFTIHFARVDSGYDSSQGRKVFFSEEKKNLALPYALNDWTSS
jgi:hypothetical protein